MIKKASSLSVLYVEDDLVMQENTAKTLNYFFNNVFVASDGIEALAMLQKNKCDVLITDYVMPNMNGYELILEVQKRYPHLVIFIASSYKDEEKLLKCIPLGLADYLVKPLNYEKLILALNAIPYKETLSMAKDIVLSEGIVFNTNTQSLLVFGNEILLSFQEVKLLLLFAKNRGTVLTKNFITAYLYKDNVDENILNNAIYRLRKKVGYDIFSTLKNIGYLLK